MRLRFNLQTFLLAFSGVAIWLGWNVFIVEQRQRVIGDLGKKIHAQRLDVKYGIPADGDGMVGWIRDYHGLPLGAVYAKQPKRATFQRQCFNARSETADTKPTYREAFKRWRCLLPAKKFEEKKHYFSFADERPFAFAGLWKTWGKCEDAIETCTLLTTEPNEEIRSVGHHRMPVVLQTEEQYALWMNPEIVERGPLEELMLPLPDGSLVVEGIGSLF